MYCIAIRRSFVLSIIISIPGLRIRNTNIIVLLLFYRRILKSRLRIPPDIVLGYEVKELRRALICHFLCRCSCCVLPVNIVV